MLRRRSESRLIMSSSCCHSSTKKVHDTCPECEKECFPVSRQTMLHQLQFPNNQSLPEGDYLFCANQHCTVGYFSISAVIPKSQLRAFQSDRKPMLCHCFDISGPVYRAALADGTAKAIKAFVVEQTKAALCACESRNPSGRCCLADFRQMEKAHDC